MRPGDRLICAFAEPRTAGTKFKDWFLHVTIVPWFRLEMTPEQIAEELAAAFAGSHPFQVKVGAETQFGYKKRKTVNLVVAPTLFRLEGQTRRWLHAHRAWLVDEADKTRNFRPHVTALKTGERLDPGDYFEIDRLYLVEQLGGQKQISTAIDLATD